MDLILKKSFELTYNSVFLDGLRIEMAKSNIRKLYLGAAGIKTPSFSAIFFINYTIFVLKIANWMLDYFWYFWIARLNAFQEL